MGNADLGITSPCAIETADRACKGKLFSREEIPDVVELCAELRSHSNAVEMVRFSLDGGRLYSASKDETIREWDVATSACTRILRAEEPYAGMDIVGATGLSNGQRASLRVLGAIGRA